jgi:dTDP-4-dehydrorhamnose reductase
LGRLPEGKIDTLPDLNNNKALMKAVLLGAKGQLGSDIVKTAPASVELIPLTRNEVDIRDRDALRRVLSELKPDIAINATAYVRVDDAEDESVLAFAINAVGVFEMARICRDIGAALFHVSTDYVFDGKKSSPYKEEDPPNPIGIYGLSKYAGEICIRNTVENFYIARVSSLYGKAGASGKGGNFVYTILKKGREGQHLKVVDDIFMSPTYTPDAAQKIWQMITEKMPCGLYHTTNSGSCSWYEFAKTILSLAGIKAQITPVPHTEYPTKARRPLNSVLESSKGTGLRHWREGLADFIKSVS